VRGWAGLMGVQSLNSSFVLLTTYCELASSVARELGMLSALQAFLCHSRPPWYILFVFGPFRSAAHIV
jgi:hypothetical protein